MMRYAIAAMQRHLDEGHAELPIVVPMLFYQGKTSPYPYSMNWLASFRNQELAKQIFCHPFPLIDVTVIPDEEIMTHRAVARLESRLEGRQEGQQEERQRLTQEMARRMLAKKMDLETIIEVTGISEDELQQLRA